MDKDLVVAYSIPYGIYRLLLCLRCAETYPEGRDKQPVNVAYVYSRCDKCGVRILRKIEE